MCRAFGKIIRESVLLESARSETRAREARGGPGEPERTSLSETAHCSGLKEHTQQEMNGGQGGPEV